MSEDTYSKYKNKKVWIDGHKFDSKDEGDYYLHLQQMQKQGKIKSFTLQPKYTLQERFRQNNKTILPIIYMADFEIILNNNNILVIDIKGFPTEVAKMKKKMFQYINKDNPNIMLKWICKSIKYGDEYGWIEYEELLKARRQAKRERKKK